MEANFRGQVMKCHDCNGSGGVGHYSTERDHFGRESKIAGSDRFFPCQTCHGSGTVTAQQYSQSVLAEDERQRVFDDEMADLQTKFEQQLRQDEWAGQRYYN
jgi:DnaJ-class molecular chaperone